MTLEVVIVGPDLDTLKVPFKGIEKLARMECIALVFLEDGKKVLVLRDTDSMGFKLTRHRNLLYNTWDKEDESYNLRFLHGEQAGAEVVKKGQMVPTGSLIFANTKTLPEDEWAKAIALFEDPDKEW